MSAGVNVTPVTSVTLEGFRELSDFRFLFFTLFLSAFLFVVFSDCTVVYLICSQRSLHRPMYVFVGAVLLNSLAGSTMTYPKLLVDLLGSSRPVVMSLSSCLFQGFIINSLGGSSFLLLGTMAFDRYLSICRPLHYSTLVTPSSVVAALLFCWLLPAALVSGATLLSSRLTLCRSRVNRIYCDIYTVVSLSCGGGQTLLYEAYGLLCAATTILTPVTFLFFSYGRILTICLHRSYSFSSKALNTCLPHILVFLNYSVSVICELLQRRLHSEGDTTVSIVTSLLIFLIPTVFNPVIYGLKVKEIFTQVKMLLKCKNLIDEAHCTAASVSKERSA